MKIKIKIPERANEAQSSPQIVASNDDLLTAILLFVPIKSLIRFKLVSKHWHSLITDPRFCISRNPNPNPAVGMFLPCSNLRINPWYQYIPFSADKSTNPPFRKLKFIKDPWGIKILHSCNGLFLCCSARVHDHNRRYYVLNPTTNKFSTLPMPSGEGEISKTIDCMSLAYDPFKSPHYKVICVRGWDLELDLDLVDYQRQFEVYSSETGSWKKCGEPFVLFFDFQNGVYWNGAINWTNYDREYLYFSPQHEVLRTLPLPPLPDGWEWGSHSYFGESCDHLHYVEMYWPQIEFNVYEMRRDFSEWFVKYRVDLSPVAAVYPGITDNNYIHTDCYCYAYFIFTMVRGEKDEDSFLVLQIPRKAIRYNLVYGTFEILHEFEDNRVEGSISMPGTNGYQYIESLLWV